jgi:hypothetical protein
VRTVSVPEPAPPAPAADRSRLRSLAPIAIFDVIGPLVAYSLLRSAGLSEVMALVLSGVLPLIEVSISVVRRRRLDVIGAVVLVGIAVGTILGLVSIPGDHGRLGSRLSRRGRSADRRRRDDIDRNRPGGLQAIPLAAVVSAKPEWSVLEGVLDLGPGQFGVAFDLVTAALGPQAPTAGEAAEGHLEAAFGRFKPVRELLGITHDCPTLPNHAAETGSPARVRRALS